ncbi:LAO/AO transport system kinase [Catalinimonas alkaloidigena]|uniref:LAO/AO transport system kinase n=1 Tax=Catalinimonas alkaloidigena TaxID=1075417 RepID=A0A1G9JB06_9BACT|nr:methylmalonyl Co-A mutase-associated GTPase MeaB [Catalinimonas alkaloidigena]SDL34628.1 LAO/AO transport system kinase [Catalinimonas alkaloidigena]
MRKRFPAEVYVEGIRRGDRLVLSRAITLVESRLPADAALAQEVLSALLPCTGKSLRVGVTGVPGVGKSTFLEVLGHHLTERGHRLAILTIDPSSRRSGGSILGDKTRMETLANNPHAYIRPSPTGDSLGGVSRKTREVMLLCEAAGFDLIVVETVGVGQSETAVRELVDCFLLLLLAGAGDELQGVKRGIMEMADVLTVTKADGPNQDAAQLARLELQHALHLFPLPASGWTPTVTVCSALEERGITDVWAQVEAFAQHTQQNGWFARNRREQNRYWLHETLRQTLLDRFYQHPHIRALLPDLENAVAEGHTAVPEAAKKLLEGYGNT